MFGRAIWKKLPECNFKIFKNHKGDLSFFIYIYNIKIYKHEIQEKLIKKHIKIQELNIYYKSNGQTLIMKLHNTINVCRL